MYSTKYGRKVMVIDIQIQIYHEEKIMDKQLYIIHFMNIYLSWLHLAKRKIAAYVNRKISLLLIG